MNLHKHKFALIIALVFLLQTAFVTLYLTTKDNTTAVNNKETIAAVNIPEQSQAKTINIIEASKAQTVTTQATTVRMVLDELQIKLGPQDKVEPGLEEALTDSIKITRVVTKNITKEQAINYPVEQKADAELYLGEQKVLQKGKKGLEKLVYEVVLADGKEIGKKLLEKIVVKAPVAQVVAVGNRQTASRSGKSIEFDRMISMSATGYTHTGRMTYTDVWPSVGTVAVDPKVIPLGTRLYIDGYGFARAMDIGGAIKSNRIDLFFNSKAEALKWGRRNVQVFILK